MKLQLVEKYLLILVLMLNLAIIYRLLTKRETFASVEEDQEYNDLYSGYVLDSQKFVTHKPSLPFEAVCK